MTGDWPTKKKGRKNNGQNGVIFGAIDKVEQREYFFIVYVRTCVRTNERTNDSREWMND